MKVFAVIPARYGSHRFPGKPLALIAGIPLLQRVIEAAKKAKLVSKLLVATDDQRIADLSKKCGVEAIMTESSLPTGTDRIWAAVQKMDCDLVINIQGDEPLITGELIDSLVEPFKRDNQLNMATLAHPIDMQDLKNENAVKVLVNQNSEAIYFSRFPIPYSRSQPENTDSIKNCYRHIGIYAYRKSFLGKYCAAAQGEAEKAEALEQLRALFMGERIKVLPTHYRSIGVDSPEDVAKIEQILGAKHES